MIMWKFSLSHILYTYILYILFENHIKETFQDYHDIIRIPKGTVSRYINFFKYHNRKEQGFEFHYWWFYNIFCYVIIELIIFNILRG